MLNPGEKKAIAIIAIVAVVFVAVVGVTVGVLVQGKSHKDDAYIQIAVGDELHQVEPARWCDVFVRDCTPPHDQPQRATPRVPVPVNSTVLLSVSQSIAESPWNLTTLYWTPQGIVEEESPKASDSTYTVALRSRPGRVLLGVTVTAASALSIDQDGSGNIARGLVTADTAPPK
ncbi:DUF2771 family protein [Gordonia sp. DT219]|uniref:DUF2771 family protein n=1 Tax=Gordonia sp. DT219 TaxID=3416658 RepID=UPI003CF559BA